MLTIDYYAENSRQCMINHLMGDYGKSEDHDRYIRNMFYGHITYSKTVNTGWISNEAYNTRPKRATLDHFITPRLMISALIETRPDILHNKNEFKNIFELCTSVVGVTSKENNNLRYEREDGKIVIKECTEEKYNKLGTWWVLKNRKVVASSKKFPLLEKIPTWFLDWEKKLKVKI
jgi:hypothetical protein